MIRKFAILGHSAWMAMVLCWTPVIASAQAVAEKTGQDKVTVAQVVDRYHEAMGGKEKLAAVKSMVTTGTIKIPEAGIEGTMELTQLAPNHTKMKMSIPQIGEQQSGFDGEHAWEVSDMMGARVMDSKETEQAKLQATMWTLWDYEKSYDSVELTGREEFAGQDCHVITVKKEGLNPVEMFFAVETGLHAGMKGVFASQMGEIEVEAQVSDYREVDGLKLSHKGVVKLPNGISQVMESEKITLNPDLEKDAFVPPKEIQEIIAEQKKKDAAGGDGKDGDK